MRTLTSGQVTALEAPTAIPRIFIWCEPRDPSSPGVLGQGFWNDLGDVVVSSRTYYGSGTVFSLEPWTAKSDLSIPGLSISMSGVSTRVNNAVRGLQLSQAPITVSFGLFAPATRAIIDGLIPVFIGVIDKVKIKTPAAGGTCDVIFTCESSSRALTVKSTLTRSGPSQKERDADDLLYDYTGPARETTIYFGRRDPNSSSKNKKG